MALNIDELKAGLEIDKLALDDEVIRQPVLFYTVSEELTNAVAERDAAKEELASVDATLADRWRRKLSKDATKRVTDSMVTVSVQTSDEHEIAFKAFLDAKLKAEKLLALKEA